MLSWAQYVLISLEPETRKTSNKRRNVKSNNKELLINFDDEKPSTSAAAAAAAAAAAEFAAKERELAFSAGKQAGGNGMQKRNVTKNKRMTGNAATGNFNVGGVGGAAGAIIATNTTAKNIKSNSNKNANNCSNKKQTKQRRKRDNSTDDESVATWAREATNANSSTAAAMAAATTAEQKYKSPFILVQRDGSLTVINAPTAEDISETKTKKLKKPVAVYAHERKNIRGMHSSTLSNKYDADTTDSSWICVFCKRGPHRMGLGDLFGPYLVSIDCDEYRAAVNAPGTLDIDAAFVSKRRRSDMIQTNARNLPVVAATLASSQLSPRKKKKKSIDELPMIENIGDPLDCTAEATLVTKFRGMSKISENSYEVWLHEDCTVWAPDVYLVGARIVGLDAAVWNSTRYYCAICAHAGAITCCLQRDCKATAHLQCARESHWSLDESTFKVYCQQHAAANVASVAQCKVSNATTESPTKPILYNSIVAMCP